MLHILFFILKLVGIILAVILGIILLLVCIVLFVPLCYKGEAESEGTLEDFRAHGQISWLFGLVRVVVDLRNKSPDFYIKIAWKKLGGRSESIQEEETEYEEGKDKEREEYGKECEGSMEQEENRREDPDIRESAGSEEASEECQEVPEGYEECTDIHEKESRISEEARKDASENPKEEQEKDERYVEREPKKKRLFTGKIKGKLQKLAEKARQAIEKFKCTIQGLCDKIEETSKKKDKLTAFITDETHMNALGKGKKELLRLLGHLPPKVFQADIRYGFEDPSLTGRVLAGFGVLYPFLGDHARITPDFQEKVLEGCLSVKGRIYIVHLAALAVRLILNKDVRRTIKDVRKFQL